MVKISSSQVVNRYTCADGDARIGQLKATYSLLKEKLVSNVDKLLYVSNMAACQELDILGQQIGFGLRILPCAPTDHLYSDFRKRLKAYSKMWTESPPEGTLERRTETYLISS